MSKLILVRHGQTDWDKQNRLQGSLDIPLNSEGKKEAQKISSDLASVEITALYSGSTACSFSTASEIAHGRKIKVKKMNDLNELNHGVWQGLLVSDIKKRYKKQYASWKISPVSGCPPKGEPIRNGYDRVVSAMHKIIDRYKGENVCIVSGGLVISMIKCHLENIDITKIWKLAPEKTWWEAFEI